MSNFRGVSYPWEGTVDGSEILHQPVEVGSLSHNLGRVFTSQVVQDIFHPSILSWRITARWAEFCPFHSFTGKLAERCFDKSVSWPKSRIIFKGARVNEEFGDEKWFEWHPIKQWEHWLWNPFSICLASLECSTAWNSKQSVFLYGCFNWMIPNHYIKMVVSPNIH